jgi:hypothetical protein
LHSGTAFLRSPEEESRGARYVSPWALPPSQVTTVKRFSRAQAQISWSPPA